MSLRAGSWVQPLCAVAVGTLRTAPQRGHAGWEKSTSDPHQVHRPAATTGGGAAAGGGAATGGAAAGGAAE